MGRTGPGAGVVVLVCRGWWWSDIYLEAWWVGLGQGQGQGRRLERGCRQELGCKQERGRGCRLGCMLGCMLVLGQWHSQMGHKQGCRLGCMLEQERGYSPMGVVAG